MSGIQLDRWPTLLRTFLGSDSRHRYPEVIKTWYSECSDSSLFFIHWAWVFPLSPDVIGHFPPLFSTCYFFQVPFAESHFSSAKLWNSKFPFNHFRTLFQRSLYIYHCRNSKRSAKTWKTHFPKELRQSLCRVTAFLGKFLLKSATKEQPLL